MSKMTKQGIAVGLLTAVLVWATTSIGSGNIHDIAEFLSGLGNDSYLWGTNLLLFAWAFRLRLKSIAWLAIKSDVAVLFVVQVPKLISEKIMFGTWTLRPDGSSGGFPSGHATHAFAMAFLLSNFFPRLWVLWYGIAIGITWSRIEMGAHTPFQLIAGTCFGLIIGYQFIHRWLIQPDSIKSCTQSQTKIAI